MTQPTYGLVFNEVNTDARPVQSADMSVIGLVLPADDADATAFPLNQPVSFDTSDVAMLGKAGDGEIAAALAAIDSQLADFQSAARVVVVRVEQGDNLAETTANIVGSAASASGLYALRTAGPRLGVVPRLIGAPGYTGHTSVVGGQTLANPVCAALPGICSSLLACAVVGGPGTDEVEAYNWRETLASDRLIPIDAWTIPGSGQGFGDGVAQVLGLGVQTDFSHEGLPFWSFAGRQVRNIAGLKNYWSFSLTDGATQGQQLLAEQIGTIQRGEIGVDTAIAGSGFVFTGLWNASTDPLKWFYNKRRGRDWTHLALLKSIRLRLGIENVTPASVDAVLRDMQAVGSYLISKRAIVGFKVDFEKSRNSPNELRQGRFVVSYAQEEPAPIARVTVDSKPFYQALEVELATLVAQAATLTPQYYS